MVTITYQGQTVTCPVGANLRRVLLQHQLTVHNGGAQLINCRGLGTCGTCAVQIVGPVSEANWRDRARRSLPPHDPQRHLRLACQTQVLGDIQVIKYEGFWGQGTQPLESPSG
ncbi:MAG: (2Fe-2S)-binding protein [Leptolyngbya sp. RL_3_1]|nr:(2Fe-2S)-binding protein [Leptolyngbya sp. RL_3_1]